MRVNSAIAAIAMLLLCAGRLAAADLAPATDVPEPPAQEEKGIWAAIAYSSPDGKYGFFWGADKRQEAMDIALKHCQHDDGKDCAVVSIFRNHRHWDDDDNTGFPYKHCGALAVSEKTAGQPMSWGSETAKTRREAEDLTLKACEREGQKCKIREWVCT